MSQIYKRQQGVALVLVLVFMLVMTIIGVSGFSQIQLEERIVSNHREVGVSLSAAETALTDGEQWIQSQSQIPEAVSTCTAVPCPVWANHVLPDVVQSTDAWWQANATDLSISIDELGQSPQYIIVKTHFIPYELSPDAQAQGRGTHYYQVTARGSGQGNRSESMVQSIFSVFYN